MTHNTDALLMGRVQKPHGLRGECKVIPETDDPGRFADLEEVFVGRTALEATSYNVVSAREHSTRRGTVILVRLEGVETVEAASTLTGSSVFALAGDLPPLADGEFFLHDTVGLSVSTDDGTNIGTVRDVLELPGSNVYVVKRPGRQDALIPAVPAFIKHVDVAASQMVLSPIDGLLD